MTSFYDLVKGQQVSSAQDQSNNLRRRQSRTSSFDKSGSVFFSPAAVASDGSWQGAVVTPTASPQVVDLSLWGIPENAKGVYVQLRGSATTLIAVSRLHLLGSNHTFYNRTALYISSTMAVERVSAGMVPVIGDRQIYYHNQGASNWNDVWLTVIGYMY